MTLRRAAILLLPFLFAATLQAQLDLGPGAPSALGSTNLVKLDGVVTVKNGDAVKGVITAAIDNGWHVNSAHPNHEFSIPTELTLDPATADLVKADYPAHEMKAFAFSGGDKLAVYEGTIRIPFEAKLKNGATSIRAIVRYQACNDQLCRPPVNAETTFSTTPTAAPAATPSATFTPLTAAPKNAGPDLSDNIVAKFNAAHGMPLTLGFLFLGGLLLNATPCVFPVIPITIGFFTMQSDGRRSRRFALSVAYVLGIVIMYATLGVVAAMAGKLFGAWLQSTGVLVFFAVLMLIFASSMFGAWEFRVPQFIANRSGGQAGVAGAALMGLLVGIVAAPCVGPVVAALFIWVASLADAIRGFAMFAALGFGLGFPYLVALSALPRPGEWMVHMKRAMGFVLIAMSFYFLRAVIGETAFRVGVSASLLVGAIFLFLAGRTQRVARAFRLTFAALLLVAGVAFAIPTGGGSHVDWKAYDASVIASAASTHKPVVIDFFADWCIPCKELDQKTFSDKSVAGELGRFERVKANLTNDKDPRVQQLTKQYGIVGVPTIVLIDANGSEAHALRLTGFENPSEFTKRLQQVR